MKVKNIAVSRPPVQDLKEVNRGYATHKRVYAEETNFFDLFSQERLQELNLWELAGIRSFSQKNGYPLFTLRDVDNIKIIQELAQLADTAPAFVLKGFLEEDFTDNDGSLYTKTTLRLEIQNGEVQVTIL